MGHHNLAQETSSTSGTGTLTLSGASTGFLSFANAGVVDGEILTVLIEEGNNKEVVRGVYDTTGPTMTRVRVLASTNGGALVSFGGTEKVSIVVAADDFLPTRAEHNIIMSDDFIGALGNTTQSVGMAFGRATNSGSLSGQETEANHPGIALIRTNTTTGCFYTPGSSSLLPKLLCRFQDVDEVTFIYKMSTAWDNAVILRFGLFKTNANPPTDGVFLERIQTDTSLYGVVRKAGTPTRTAALLADDTNWHKVTIRRNSSTSWTFIVDGTETTVSGDANIPTDSDLAYLVMSILNSSGAVIHDVFLDYVSISMKGIVR